MGDIDDRSWTANDLRLHCIQEENRKRMENNKLFCYGILKRGYALDLNNHGAKFLGEAHIEGATLYSIGGRGVGLRLTGDDSIAHGELWEIPKELWKWLDHIEGNGFNYERKIVPVQLQDIPGDMGINGDGVETVHAYVYEHMFKGFTDKDKIKGGKF